MCGGFGGRYFPLLYEKNLSFWGDFPTGNSKEFQKNPPTSPHQPTSNNPRLKVHHWNCLGLVEPTTQRLRPTRSAERRSHGNGWKNQPLFLIDDFLPDLSWFWNPIFVFYVFFSGVCNEKNPTTLTNTVKKQLRSNQDVVKITGLVPFDKGYFFATCRHHNSRKIQMSPIYTYQTHIPENTWLELEGHGGLLQMFLFFFGFQKCDFQDPRHSYNSKQNPTIPFPRTHRSGPYRCAMNANFIKGCTSLTI